jgi:hypothetical protein
MCCVTIQCNIGTISMRMCAYTSSVCVTNVHVMRADTLYLLANTVYKPCSCIYVLQVLVSGQKCAAITSV